MSGSTRHHWDEDRDFDLVMEFVYDKAEDGDEYVSEAMKMWLGVPEETMVNVEHMVKAFEAMDRPERRKILEEYVDEMGDTYAFDDWYREREGIDPADDRPKNDGDGIEDDMYEDDWMHSDRLAGDGRF